jgi:hypothetical protein
LSWSFTTDTFVQSPRPRVSGVMIKVRRSSVDDAVRSAPGVRNVVDNLVVLAVQRSASRWTWQRFSKSAGRKQDHGEAGVTKRVLENRVYRSLL